eukprot:s2444_g5.t1
MPHGRTVAVGKMLRSGALTQQNPGYDGLWANTTFESMGVHPTLVSSMAVVGLVETDTVRLTKAFGPIVKGRDVILRAETGSGKTLAYLLPLVNRIYHLHDRARQAAQDPDAPNPLQSRGLVSRHRGRLVARSAAVLQEKKGKHEDMMRQASCSNQI